MGEDSVRVRPLQMAVVVKTLESASSRSEVVSLGDTEASGLPTGEPLPA